MSTTATPADRQLPRIVLRPIAAGRRGAWVRCLPLLLLLVLPVDAFAYLDPGTGSILIQGLIATIAAATTFASLFWQRIKRGFASLLGRSHRSDDDDSAAP